MSLPLSLYKPSLQELRPDGLLIKPIKKPRAQWEAAIAAALENHAHDLDHEWLNADLLEDDK